MRPDTQTSSASELQDWLTLYRAPGIGASRFRQLVSQLGSPRLVLQASHAQLRDAGIPRAGIDYLRNPDRQLLDSDLQWLSEPGNRLISYQDAAFPALLKEIPDPPALLFTHGDIDYLAQPQLAIVGSRNPTHEGRDLAQQFASHLAARGLTITSGLADGIDGAAHEGALAGGGATVAVTGTGLDRVYPASHRELAHRIAENGVLVSEYPPGTAPVAANFPRRNRIISGLSLGTLVVEAALRSGSLITARAALNQGREVFAIPGSIHNPLARGCHALIREGAKLVETGDHVLEELAGLISLSLNTGEQPGEAGRAVEEPSQLGVEYGKLLDAMGFEPVSVDQLVTRSGLTPEEVSSMLLLLELDDYLVSEAGGRYTRVR